MSPGLDVRFLMGGGRPSALGCDMAWGMVPEPALERVTRVVGEDWVPREYGYGEGKLYLHVHRTCIPRVDGGLWVGTRRGWSCVPWRGPRMAMLPVKPPMAVTTLDTPKWLRKCLYSLAYYQ